MDGGVKLAALAVAGLLVLPASSGAFPGRPKGPYQKGQIVAVSGQVTTSDGRPLPGVTVLLSASRKAFSLKKFRRQTGTALQMPATVDGDGRYQLNLRWDPYYNTFELAVALEVRKGGRDVHEGGRDVHEVYHRQDITRQVMQASPVGIPLVVQGSAAIEELRTFLGSLKSDDEKRIYQEMGRPDRIDVGQIHYDPDRSWWYFRAGKVYRFREGKLDEVVPFEPVSEP